MASEATLKNLIGELEQVLVNTEEYLAQRKPCDKEL
jgi:hypothetical protein